MKIHIGIYQFRDAFRECGRSDQFSYEGLEALFEYLEAWEEDCGEEIELDVIGLCCDYSEYEGLNEFHSDYDADDYPDLDTIAEYTCVIPVGCDGGFIVGQF